MVQVITGLKVTTLREPSWWTRYWMWFAEKPKAVTAYKAFNSRIPLGEVLGQAWAPC